MVMRPSETRSSTSSAPASMRRCVVTVPAVTRLMSTRSCPTPPAASVTRAVMRWAPGESAEVVNEGPAPIEPSRSEVQARFAARLPCSGSTAVAAKPTAELAGKAAPSVGLVMFTLGSPLTGPAATQLALPESLKLLPATGRNCQS